MVWIRDYLFCQNKILNIEAILIGNEIKKGKLYVAYSEE